MAQGVQTPMWPRRLAFSILLCIESIDLAGAQSTCGGVPPVSGPTGYQRRLNAERCEGFYQQQVAGNLEFLSLVNGAINYDLVSDKALIVSVPSAGLLQAPQISLTARALRPGIYYRMDAVVPPSGTLKWPLDAVLAPARMPPETIGVVGWIDRDLGKYYVPVSVVSENVAASAPRAPVMILRPSLDTEVLKWRSRRETGGNARAEEWITVGGTNPQIIRGGQLAKLELRGQPSGALVVEIAAKYVNVERAQTQLIRVIMP